MTDLAGSCAAIAALIPEARQLIHQPDEDGSTSRGQPGSRPPWNQAAANAYTDAHEGIRRLAASLHRDVFGHTGRPFGPDDTATGRALNVIENDGRNVPEGDAQRAARILGRWARAIELLAAIDTAEPWRTVKTEEPRACPYCNYPMLRVGERSGMVTCLRRGRCHDDNGRHPVGYIDKSQLTGDDGIRWNDGRFT